MRRQVISVEYSKVVGYFFVATHREGGARTDIHAAQSSSDQGEENGEGLDK
jgi:hypothetical protein